MKKCFVLFFLFASSSSFANLIVYEVYAGGGNSGAAYQDDYVVLFNNGANLTTGTNWSLQYESSTGSGTWDIFPLPNVTINAGGYYFIKIETSGTNGFEYTSNDASTSALGTTSGIAASGGKIAIFEHIGGVPVAFVGSDPTIVTSTTLLLRDMLGYGTADASETSPAQSMHTNSTVLYRTGGDTNNNSADFARNSNLSTGSFAVDYTFFEGRAKKAAINLNWQTSTEINNQGFEVEKSRNAVNFETIARIDGAGNSQDLTNYYFTDEQPFTGSNYYRLKQKDFDGTLDYSKIIQVFFDAEGDFVSIFPNPLAAGQNLNIEKSESLQLNNIRNINGQSFQKTENLKEGLYFFQFTNPNGGSVVKKLVVN